MRTFSKICYFMILNMVLLFGLNITLSQPSAVKVLMKEAKNIEYNILIIGQSHGTTSIDPFVVSAEMNSNAFNISRRIMPVKNLYYILCEANVNKNYKTVILDIDPSYWVQGHRGNYGVDTNLSLRLTGARLIEYFTDIMWKDNYNDTFCNYIVSPDNIKRIPAVIKAKLTPSYLCNDQSSIEVVNSVVGTSKSYTYKGRGFRYGVKKSNIEWPTWKFDETMVKEENLETFNKIVNYCNENEIRLICIQSALPPYRLLNENMVDVHDYFNDLCSEAGVPFYDMNYLKREYLVRSDDDYVDLDGHMMGELAERHTAVLTDILNAENKEGFFYNSYEEVLENLD